MEGRILGNRYELMEKIGGGGMALVFKAKCRLLNRFVAVKILRPEFINDEEFVKRFRIEAQSAASLSHPNIVSIYDVGQEDNIQFIVMEYVDGITLKEYISKKGSLVWEEAVDIAIQICLAIEHAHRNRIVHRDIKPHNILLTKEGVAKVTDFGIARAVSSSTITMVGSTIGSVHYFSPEQARGGFIDEKSDLYSLGIALYEMVTGKLPFNGETPVAIALKHIQDRPLQPVDINNKIPKGVNDIIMKAITKDQGKRYQTASDMLEDLYRALKEPDGGFVTVCDMEDSPTKRVKAVGDTKTNRTGDFLVKDKSSGEKKKKGDKLAILFGVITGLIIITIFGYMAYNFVMPSITPGEKKGFEVKNYVGRYLDEINDELSAARAAGIEVKIIPKNDDNILKDVVISQKPEAGKELIQGGFNNYIELEVSDGPKLIKIPDFKNTDYREAESNLSSNGLVTSVVEEFNDTIGSSLVVRTDPDADAEVKVGSSVTIYKSKGPEPKPAKVPDLIGKTQMEASRLLADAKLKIGKVFPEAGSNYVAKIIKQEPAAGTEVDEGSAVDLYMEADTDGQSKTVYRIINLGNSEKYRDKIRVRIEVTPSDTNKTAIILDYEKNKADFPFSIPVPVPEKGSTRLCVFYDDKLNGEENVELPGR